MGSSPSGLLIRRISVVAALAVACAGGAWFFASSRKAPAERIADAAADLEYRPTEARVAGFEHVKLPARGTVPMQLRMLAATAAEEHEQDRHTLAIVDLVSGNASAAVAHLESSERDEARYWNDLAVARYEAAREDGDPLVYAKALAAAERALDLATNDEEPLFNRALILERLGFLSDAASAWRDYLELDRESAWADEARARLRELSSPPEAVAWKQASAAIVEGRAKPGREQAIALVRRFPQQSRVWTEGDFLARWADATLKSDARGAAHWLDVSRTIATEIRARSGDSLAIEAVEAIETANAKRARQLAETYVVYRRGRMLLAQRRPFDARPLLAEAQEGFARTGSPMALVAEYFRGNATHDLRDRAEAAAIADRLLSTIPPRFASLRAQATWLKALSLENAGRPHDALEACDAALHLFDRLGERDNATRMRSLGASLLAVLGRDREAWQRRSRAFRDAALVGSAPLMELVLNSAARDEIRARRWDVARALLRLEVSRTSASPRLRADGLTWLAFVESAMTGRPPDFTAAASACRRIADESLRTEALNEIRFATAVHRRRDTTHAIQLLSSVLESAVTASRPVLRTAAYIERGRAYRELGDLAAARRDLEEAVAATEAGGTTIRELQVRDTFFGASHDAYGELFALLTAQGRHAEAFEIAGRGRARLLTERRGVLPPEAFSIASLQERMPADGVVAQYTALADRLVITAVAKRAWRTEVVPIGRAALRAATRELVSALAKNDDRAAERAAAELYRRLLAPVADLLAGPLFLVHDEVTAEIPFAALRTPRGWLAAERLIASIPNSASFRTASGTHDYANVTVVADPAIDPARFPALPPLRSARNDAARIARIFPHARSFVGAQATAADVVPAIERSDLVLVAAHAISDERDAARSSIVLAPAAGDSGALYSSRIAAMRLAASPVVVLAGCRTSSAGGGHSSTRSLALSFLAAGSEAVVGTLWDIDDAAASRLTSELYRSLRNGDGTAAALRNAQLDAIRGGQHPRHWAAFQIHLSEYRPGGPF